MAIEKYYTIKEVAEILRYTYTMILQHIKSGDLKSYRVGRGHRIAESDLKRFLKENK